MGALLSRWRDIQALEALKKGNVESQRRIVTGLILYSILIYIVVAVVFYLWFLPEDTNQRVLSVLPLLFFPVLIWLIKRFLHWYFVNRITKNESALEDLRLRKKEMLEQVMETETYKKAKEILERFDPEQHKKLEKESTENAAPTPKGTPGADLRQRKGPGVNVPENQMGTPKHVGQFTPRPGYQVTPGSVARNGQMRPQGSPQRFPPPGPPMSRPVLPRERSMADRLMEMLVGDGPQNRYALICKECVSHNGMALREEFEFIAFRCCYCFTLNPAKKKRPRAPKIDYLMSPRPDSTEQTTKGDVTSTPSLHKDEEEDQPDTREENKEEEKFLSEKKDD